MRSLILPRSFATRLSAAVVSTLCVTLLASAADEPDIHVALGAEEIFIGESVDYQIEIRNAKSPPAPDLTAIKDQFEIAEAGDESRDQSSISIINGRVSKQNILSHVYHYRLTPRKAGDLIIPAATVTIDGKVLTGSEVPLRVVAAEEQDLVVVETEVSQARVYPTQPFTVTLRILIQPLPNDANTDPLSPLRRRPPHVQINWVDPLAGLSTDEKSHWLQPRLSEEGIGFTINDVNTHSGSFFDGPRAAVFNLLKGRENRKGLDGETIRYFVYELKRTFTAEKTGLFSFGPAVVKGTFVKGIERREYAARRLVVTSSAATVDVREVPSPRPPMFCGGIGEYKVTASASPLKLRVGDPLTLTLEFERESQSGSLDLISAPDLSAIPQLAEDFDLIDRNPTGRMEGTTKKFAYALRPRQANVTIPSMKLATFDPKTEDFVAIETKAIPLEVSEAERVSSGDLVGSRNSNNSSSIKTRSEGIFQNITDPREVRNETVSLLAWTEGTLGVWCVMGLLSAVVQIYRGKTSDARWMRRQGARGTANRRIAEARTLARQGETIEALRKVRSAVVGMVADLRDRVPEGLTTADIGSILAASSLPVDDQTQLLNLLEQIESAEFGAGSYADPMTSIELAAQLINRIAPVLERGTAR